MLGDRLRDLREKSGFSRERLAEELDIGSASIARYERGEGDATSEVLLKFARFFSVSVDYLLGLSDDPTEYVVDLNDAETKAISAWRRGDVKTAIKAIIDDE